MAPSAPPWDDDVPFDDEPEARGASVAPRTDPPLEPVPATATPRADDSRFVPTAAGDRWAEIVRALVAADVITALPRALALQCQCLSVDDAEHRIALRVDSDSLRQSVHVQKLQAALATHLAHPVELDLQAGAVHDSVAQRDHAERQRRQAEAQRAIDSDPLVIQLTARYPGARIVPGSVRPV